MNLDVVLAGVSFVLLFPALAGTVLLVQAATVKPRIGALTDRAIIAVAICVMIVSGVVITLNRLTGYGFFPIEVARVLFLSSLVALEIVPLYWLWLWHTGRLGQIENGDSAQLQRIEDKIDAQDVQSQVDREHL